MPTSGDAFIDGQAIDEPYNELKAKHRMLASADAEAKVAEALRPPAEQGLPPPRSMASTWTVVSFVATLVAAVVCAYSELQVLKMVGEPEAVAATIAGRLVAAGLIGLVGYWVCRRSWAAFGVGASLVFMACIVASRSKMESDRHSREGIARLQHELANASSEQATEYRESGSLPNTDRRVDSLLAVLSDIAPNLDGPEGAVARAAREVLRRPAEIGKAFREKEQEFMAVGGETTADYPSAKQLDGQLRVLADLANLNDALVQAIKNFPSEYERALKQEGLASGEARSLVDVAMQRYGADSQLAAR